MDRSRIAALVFFAGLPETELDAAAQVATEAEFAPGKQLTNEGDLGHSLFVIESGTAAVTAGGAVVASVGQGDLVGEVAVLASGRRTASVVASSQVRAIEIFKRDVWRLESTAPEAATRLRAAIADHVGPPAGDA